MKLWEFVLSCDDDLDLTSRGDGRAFGAVRAHGDEWAVPGMDNPNDWFELWQRNVCVLRSLAGRLERKRTRAAGIDPAEADAVLDDYLSRVRAKLLKAPPPRPGRKKKPPTGPVPTDATSFAALIRGDETPEKPLTRATFAGLTLESTGENGAHDQYWQDVFLSLVDERFSAPVCGGCGNPLPPSAKGRTSRRELCATCKTRKYRAGLSRSPDVLAKYRERDRQVKAAKRGKGKKSNKQRIPKGK